MQFAYQPIAVHTCVVRVTNGGDMAGASLNLFHIRVGDSICDSDLVLPPQISAHAGSQYGCASLEQGLSEYWQHCMAAHSRSSQIQVPCAF